MQQMQEKEIKKENKEKKSYIQPVFQKKKREVRPVPLKKAHPFDVISENTLQRRLDEDGGMSSASEAGKDKEYFQELLKREAIRRLNINKNEVSAVRERYGILGDNPDSEEAASVWEGFTQAMEWDKSLLKKEEDVLVKKSLLQTEAMGLINIRGPMSRDQIDAMGERARERNSLLEQCNIYLEYIAQCRNLLNSEYPVTRLVNSRKGGDLNKEDAFQKIREACDNALVTFDEVENKVLTGDMPLYKMEMIVNDVLTKEGITPDASDAYGQSVNQWLKVERRWNKAIEILGMIIPLALGAACFIPGIGLGAIVALGAIGAGVGGAAALYDFEMADDLHDAGKASAAGSENLVDAEAAKLQYIMASVSLCLSAVDLFMAGRAVKSLVHVSKIAAGTSKGAGVLKLLDDSAVTTLAKLGDDKMKIIFESVENGENLKHILKNKTVLKKLEQLTPDELSDFVRTSGDDLGVKLLNSGLDPVNVPALKQAEDHNKLVLENVENGAITQGIYKKEYLEELKSFHDNIDEVLSQFNMTEADFHALKMKRIEDLTVDEQALMRRIRDLVPPPTEETLMQKVIPWGDIEKFFDVNKPKTLSGYIAKASDGVPYASYDEIMKSFRLDYYWEENGQLIEPFLKPQREGKGYGLIRFKASNTDDIAVPYGETMGGIAKDGDPCTLNGFAGGENGSIIPEYKVPWTNPMDIKKGAEFFYVNPDGTEVLIGIYNTRKGVFEKIK